MALDPYLLLAAAEGCGPALVAPLLDPSQDPAQLIADPPSLPPSVARRISFPEQLAATVSSWLQAAARHDITVLTPNSPAYPASLRHLPLRPLVLFARGNLDLLQQQVKATLTVVGSRTPTAYGEAAAMDFVAAATGAGLPIWSGLALGIDGVAHRTALEHRGATVAMLAGGLDQVYPRHHERLAQEILARHGLLLSETPPGYRAQRGHFPRRNRILAGVASAVLVVEAGQRSGSLHTARFAADVGVSVYCVPGPYQSPRSRGCHDLIADGAQIAACPEDLLRRLGVEAGDAAALDDSADETAILNALLTGPRPQDLVQRETGMPRPRYLAAVLSLKGRGRIREMPGDLLAVVRT